jgi:hypothetical protein
MLVDAALALLWMGQIHFIGEVHFVGPEGKNGDPDGARACPSAAEVEQAFLPIAEHDLEPGGPGETVTVRLDRVGRAVIRFASDGTDPFADRVLPAEMSCAERAKAAAVIVAAHVRHEEVESQASASVQRQPQGAQPVAVPRDIGLRVIAPAPAPSAPSSSLQLEIGAVTARGGSNWAPGVRGGLGYGISGRDRVGLGLSYVGSARTEVAGGQAVWTRAAVALEYARRVATSSAGAGFVDLGLALRASRLSLGSEGFHQSETSAVFHPGVGAGGRGGYRLLGSTVVWAGIDGVLWPRKQAVFLRDVPETTTIPRWELMASVGASWSLR